MVAIHAGSLGLLVNLNRSPPRNHITLVCVPGIRTVPLPKLGTMINKIKPTKTINSGHSAAINPSPNGSHFLFQTYQAPPLPTKMIKPSNICLVQSSIMSNPIHGIIPNRIVKNAIINMANFSEFDISGIG